MPPRKIRIRAFNIHKDVSRCNTTPNSRDDPTKFKHKTSGWEIKTLTSKSKKKLEIITPEFKPILVFYPYPPVIKR